MESEHQTLSDPHAALTHYILVILFLPSMDFVKVMCGHKSDQFYSLIVEICKLHYHINVLIQYIVCHNLYDINFDMLKRP